MLINPYRFGRLWTPADITTALWLDAADASTVTVSSGLISQVNDKSGNGRNFTASGSARPTYTSNALNGLPVFTFGGTQWLTSSSPVSTWNFLHQAGGAEVIGVWKIGNIADPNTLYGLFGTNAGTVNSEGIYIRFDDRAANSFNNALIAASVATLDYVFQANNNAQSANTPSLSGVSLDLGNAVAASRIVFLVNGTLLTGSNTSASPPSSATAAYALQLGAAGNNVWPLTGYNAELLIFNSKLSTNNRQLVEGYLAHKWGLAANLPAGHPYKSAAPTV